MKIDLFLADLNCVYDFFELRTPGTLRDHSAEAETRRPSHKLPALVNNSMSDFAKIAQVRDHAVASINRRNKTTESGEHAGHRLSLIGEVNSHVRYSN